ncbi:MAG: hypothetical protein U0V04_19355 [Spirosomataceae bacterium]|jgi:hypothetical protein
MKTLAITNSEGIVIENLSPKLGVFELSEKEIKKGKKLILRFGDISLNLSL